MTSLALILGFVQFIVAAFFVIIGSLAYNSDPKAWAVEDKRLMRLCLLALFTAPFAIIVLPLAIIGCLLYGISLAIKAAI